MLSVKNNLMALNAARHLGTSYGQLARSVERLSSGLRINSAKDDAAGLAVRELIRANIATLRQGGRNARDAISMMQTGEGAMQVMDDILVRLKELAEQAATDSYSADQRAIMDAEFQQLGAELSRIATSTTFNEIELLNAAATYKIHIGTTETVDIETVSMTGDALGITKSKTIGVNMTEAASKTSEDFLDSTAAINFDFTFGTENTVDVNFGTLGSADGDELWTMKEVNDAINVASQTEASYNASKIVYSAETKLYQLKLSAKAGGDGLLVIVTDDGSALADSNWIKSTGSEDGLVIKTQIGAEGALADIDDAIKTKDEYRAKLGYLMNRLEAAASVLDIQAENLQAAESRVSDVDVASEMAAMTRTQVLAQAGISMLAQANMMPQMALKLLG